MSLPSCTMRAAAARSLTRLSDSNLRPREGMWDRVCLGSFVLRFAKTPKRALWLSCHKCKWQARYFARHACLSRLCDARAAMRRVAQADSVFLNMPNLHFLPCSPVTSQARAPLACRIAQAAFTCEGQEIVHTSCSSPGSVVMGRETAECLSCGVRACVGIVLAV